MHRSIYLIFVFHYATSIRLATKRAESGEEDMVMLEDKVIEKTTCPQGCKCAIPRRIVQTVKSRSVPKRLAHLVYKIRDMNPEYDHVFFDDDEATAFIASLKNEGLQNAYNKLTKGAMKADLFRLAYLAVNGGLYFDVDIRGKQPIPLKCNDEYVSGLGCKNRADGKNSCLHQWNIISAPKHPFVVQALERAVHNIETDHADILPYSPEGYLGGLAGPAVLNVAAKTVARVRDWKPGQHVIPGLNTTYTILDGDYLGGTIDHCNLHCYPEYVQDMAKVGMKHWSNDGVK